MKASGNNAHKKASGNNSASRANPADGGRRATGAVVMPSPLIGDAAAWFGELSRADRARWRAAGSRLMIRDNFLVSRT